MASQLQSVIVALVSYELVWAQPGGAAHADRTDGAMGNVLDGPKPPET